MFEASCLLIAQLSLEVSGALPLVLQVCRSKHEMAWSAELHAG